MACQRPEITKDFGFDDYVPEWSYNNWRKKNNLPDYVWQDSRWVMGGYDPVDKMQSRTHWLAQRVIEMIRNINPKVKNGMSVLIRVIRIYHVILFVSFSLCMIRKKYRNGRTTGMICRINPIFRDSRFIIGSWKIRIGDVAGLFAALFC